MDLVKPLILVLLVVISAFLLVPKHRINWAAGAEGFASANMTLPRGTGTSTTAIFHSAADQAAFDKEIYAARDVIDDRDDVLHARDCYQFPADGTNRLSAGLRRIGVLFSEIKTLTFSGDEIKSKIVQEVLDTQKRLPGDIIRGPVYAFITQAPFYRDPSGREMTLQFTVNDYLLKPYNIMKATAPGEMPPPIYVTIYIVYTGYNARRQRLPQPMNLYQLPVQSISGGYVSIQTLRSRDKMCKMMCPQTSSEYPMFCGCATGTHPYNSTCLGPTNEANKNVDKVVKSTFIFGYLVNQKEPAFLKNKTFPA
jgi:hypothetical protein